MFENVVTIKDCVNAGIELKREAAHVTTMDSHKKFWNKTTELLKIVNDALETGYWTGDGYDMLWMAKHQIYKAQDIAGLKALEYQNRGR